MPTEHDRSAATSNDVVATVTRTDGGSKEPRRAGVLLRRVPTAVRGVCIPLS